MSLATIRTAIAGRLGTVQGIGAVHDYYRHVTTEAERKDLQLKSGRLHFWCVTLAPADAYTTKRFPANHTHSTYTFQIHGFYALDDKAASEKTFSDLTERVIEAFEVADKKLGLATVIEAGPAQWVEGGGPEGMRMLPPGEGGVLCHYARLVLPVKEQTEP